MIMNILITVSNALINKQINVDFFKIVLKLRTWAKTFGKKSKCRIFPCQQIKDSGTHKSQVLEAAQLSSGAMLLVSHLCSWRQN